MEFNDLETMCERAGRFVFSRSKIVMTAVALLMGLFLVAVSMLFSYMPSMWGSMSPFLLLMLGLFCVLLGLGVALISNYHDEVKNKPVLHSHILLHTYRVLSRAAPLLMPLLLGLAGLWVLEGVCTLLREVPYLGAVIRFCTSFIPFLWMVGLLSLTVISLYLLFTLAPVLALKNLSKEDLFSYMERQLKEALFVRVFLFIVAILPLLVVEKFLVAAARWAMASSAANMQGMPPLFQNLFLLIPAALIIIPTIIFFFNMAAEAHIFIQKRGRGER